MVPIRRIFETIGATVDFDQKNQRVTAIKNSDAVAFVIGSNEVNVNGMTQTLDTSLKTVNGRTMAPLRFSVEAFGYYVKWDNKSSSAYISETPFSDQLSASESGSLVGNINNMGQVCEKGDWIYYSNVRDLNDNTEFGEKIYRMKTDGSSREQLNDDISRNLVVAEDKKLTMITAVALIL